MEFAELESFIYNNPTIDDFPTFIKSLSSFIPQVGYEDFSLVIEAFLDNQLLHNGHGFSLPMKINDKLYHFSILKMTNGWNIYLHFNNILTVSSVAASIEGIISDFGVLTIIFYNENKPINYDGPLQRGTDAVKVLLAFAYIARIKEVALTDKAIITCGINLSLTRKIGNLPSWYEEFGFIPLEKETHAYHTALKYVQELKISNFGIIPADPTITNVRELCIQYLKRNTEVNCEDLKFILFKVLNPPDYLGPLFKEISSLIKKRIGAEYAKQITREDYIKIMSHPVTN